MKKNLIYAGMLLLGIMVATSCSNEEHLEQMMSNGNTVQAVIENVANTRTSVNESYQVVWTTEDRFDVWDDDEFKGVLKLKSGAGTTSASYKDADPENPVNATSGMTAFFPSYDGTPNKKAFVFLETYDSQETDAPMLGSFDGSKFTFNLLTAMVRVVVADVPAGEISFTISSKNNEILTGEAVLNNENKLDVPTQGVTSVAVNFTTNESKTLTFDVPVPVQNYTSGFQVVVKSGNQEVLNKITNGFNAEAGKLYLFGATYVYVADADDASNKLDNDEITAVKVQSVESNDVITVPIKSETSAQAEHTIDLSEATMPSEGSVTIKVTEASSGDTESTVEKLTVIVPDNTTSGSFTVDAPGTTVTIQGAGGTIIDVIESTTADHTLIIGEGVTVKSLTINKGNVKLEACAQVELFKVKDVAGLKNAIELGGNIKLENAIDLNLTSGATLTIASGKDVVIDLNSKTLTTSSSANNPVTDDITVQGKLSISNGAISTANALFYVKDGDLSLSNCSISVSSEYTPVYAEGGTVTAEKVTANVQRTAFNGKGTTMKLTDCEAVSANGAYNVVSVSESGNLTVSGGSYTSTENAASHDLSYAIAVLGGSTATINTTVSGGNGGVTVLGASTVEFTGGSYTGMKACGLYVNEGSTVTYKDCTFSGEEADVKVGPNGGTINGTSFAEATELNVVSEPEELKSIITNGGYAILANEIALDVTTGSLTIASGKEVVIDLNSKTLTTSSSANTPVTDDITIEGKLSISNGTISTANALFYVKGGDLSLSNCSISVSSEYTPVYAEGGTVTAEKVTANVQRTAFNGKGTTMKLTDCEAVSANGAYNVVAVSESGNLTVSGGLYTSTENAASHDLSYAIAVLGGSEATINTTVSGGNGGVTVLGGSTAELTGGSYTGVKACGLYVNEASTVTYTSDCTFSGKEAPIKVADAESSATQK